MPGLDMVVVRATHIRQRECETNLGAATTIINFAGSSNKQGSNTGLWTLFAAVATSVPLFCTVPSCTSGCACDGGWRRSFCMSSVNTDVEIPAADVVESDMWLSYK